MIAQHRKWIDNLHEASGKPGVVRKFNDAYEFINKLRAFNEESEKTELIIGKINYDN
jgi:hypothetical protein